MNKDETLERYLPNTVVAALIPVGFLAPEAPTVAAGLDPPGEQIPAATKAGQVQNSDVAKRFACPLIPAD